MSRREEEFKHRTSIFEGAYRAWSHLGGLDPEVLRSKSATELDPITFPLTNDSRVKKAVDGDRPEYPYEPLPRAGLTHPYIQAVLSPWLGPNADHDAVELGLATLRTWWQHRRKGENKSAIKVLGTASMRAIVDKYTRHFFELAHCLVVNDQVQPPRSLHLAMKGSDSSSLRAFGKDEDDLSSGPLAIGTATGIPSQDDEGDFLLNLSPLERVHLVQKNAIQNSLTDEPVINVKGKCIPGKIDLPGIVDAVKRHANTLAHRGVLATKAGKARATPGDFKRKESDNNAYGDPNTVPIIFQTNENANLIIMEVDGITCAHCVKIVETVLKGCQGGKSPIAGLLDAAADRAVSCVVVAIDHPANAKRIAFESARNLKLVGYTARVKEVSTPTGDASEQETLYNSVVRMAKAYPFDFFHFSAPCSCPDSGVYRDNCQRHSQMNEQMFHAVMEHERAVRAYVDSTLAGVPIEIGEGRTTSAWMEAVGSIEIATPPTSLNFSLAMGGEGGGTGCVDYACNPLVIEQTMEFVTHESALAAMQEASHVEPIPYRRGGPQQQRPVLPSSGFWSNPSRQSISALAVDWDTLEFMEDDLGGGGSRGVSDHPLSHHDEAMYQV